ncbi:hypothetical protein HY970_04075 [Candidatus Kaiserbacteria bacterium]|nr:hypothetical protein [Candidatus Kaiserbacteria bacterium]
MSSTITINVPLVGTRGRVVIEYDPDVVRVVCPVGENGENAAFMITGRGPHSSDWLITIPIEHAGEVCITHGIPEDFITRGAHGSTNQMTFMYPGKECKVWGVSVTSDTVENKVEGPIPLGRRQSVH